MGTILLFLSLTAVLTLPRSCVAMETGDDVYQQLLRRVENLEHRDQQQQQEIDTLRGDLSTEKQRTAVLEERIIFLQERLAERDEKDEAKPIVLEEKDQAGVDVGIVQKDSQQSLDPFTSRNVRSAKPSGARLPMTTRRHADMPVVAFHALLTNHSQITEAKQAITFDHVVTDLGNVYDPSTGYFSAPLAGIYVFQTTIMVNFHHYTHASIVANGASVANLYIRGIESAWESESAMAIVHLNKGDDCYVENTDANKTINGYDYSMFAGFLLYPDAGAAIVG